MSGSPDYTTTPNLGLYRPNYDMDDGTWGVHLNANADVLDSAIGNLRKGILPTVLTSAANDAAAATAGVPVGGLYHNAGAVRVRLT
jgi:hypothetical protein